MPQRRHEFIELYHHCCPYARFILRAFVVGSYLYFSVFKRDQVRVQAHWVGNTRGGGK